MTKARNLAIPVILLSVLVLGSCGFGLQPAWQQTGGTTIKIDFSQTGSDARAISLGTGYLYIRTVGGPEGDNGPLYGPYEVNTPGVFATSDIPAGTYSKFCIVYSAVSLDDNAEFKALISLPDADFVEQVVVDGYVMSSILDGVASGLILSDVVIVDGAINLISGVMTPFIDEEMAYHVLQMGGYTSTEMNLPDVGTSVHKRFIKISNIESGLDPIYYPFLICEFSLGTYGPAAVKVIRLYDEEGKLLFSRTNATPVDTGIYVDIEFPYTGGTDYYLYIEYSADVMLYCYIYNNA